MPPKEKEGDPTFLPSIYSILFRIPARNPDGNTTQDRR